MKKLFYAAAVMIICIGFSFHSSADQTIVAVKTDNAPKIDGIGDEPEWNKAVPIITYENIGKIEIMLRAIYTDKEIFFLVMFPDTDESRDHRNYTWDKEKKMYVIGPEREDNFVFKWNMESKPVDLSVYADNPYTSDIWYWKSCRTDPVGYADDKYDILAMDKAQSSNKIISKKGNTFYYGRYGDDGTAAYMIADMPVDYKGHKLSMFKILTPTGSRADIAAKGQWKQGKWTIEFKRLLFTGNQDDIQFNTSETYQFGIARYEIAGQKPDPKEHYYGSGDVAETLFLKFSE